MKNSVCGADMSSMFDVIFTFDLSWDGTVYMYMYTDSVSFSSSLCFTVQDCCA